MDTQKLRELAESAEERANHKHKLYQLAIEEAEGHTRHMRNLAAEAARLDARGFLNDFFYWQGHAVAYRGVIAMIELQTVIDDERDAEPTCP